MYEDVMSFREVTCYFDTCATYGCSHSSAAHTYVHAPANGYTATSNSYTYSTQHSGAGSNDSPKDPIAISRHCVWRGYPA